MPIPDPLVEDRRERIMLAGDLPSPANPPERLPVPHPVPVAAGGALRHRAAKAAGGADRRVPASHRVACHYAEQIQSGEIVRHEVRATATDPSADTSVPTVNTQEDPGSPQPFTLP